MGSLQGRIEHAVHICVDMQRLFGPGGPWAAPWVERILPPVTKLVQHSPSRTIFTRFIPAQSAHEASGMWKKFYQKWDSVTLEKLDTQFLQLLPPLDRFAPPAKTFDRKTYSAFANGRLHRWLNEREVNTIIISGAETDVCVLATVLSAVDLGYRSIMVRDALASSADRTHDALLALYDGRFDIQIELTDSKQLMDAWRPTS